jgi:hypothetical protein
VAPGEFKIVDHIVNWSEASLAIIGVFAAMWVGVKKVYRMARNIESLVETSIRNEKRLTDIESQLVRNSGQSLRDAVHRIEEVQVDVLQRLNRLEECTCKGHENITSG